MVHDSLLFFTLRMLTISPVYGRLHDLNLTVISDEDEMFVEIDRGTGVSRSQKHIIPYKQIVPIFHEMNSPAPSLALAGFKREIFLRSI